MNSNFICPPNIPTINERKNHSVLLIDPTRNTVVEIGQLCKLVGTDFDVYLYTHIFDDLKWLETAFNVVDAVLINTDPTTISPVKDRLVFHQKAYHYGPKRFLDNDKSVVSAEEYFLRYIQAQQNLDLTN